MSTSLVEGGIESCYPRTKNLANHEHENAIILDECVYSHTRAAIRTSHAQIIIHQMKCMGLNHKHLKEPNQSNLSGRRPMP